MKKKISDNKGLIFVIITAVIILGIALVLYFTISYILALIFLLLAEAFIFSLLAARDVVEIELVAQKVNEDVSIMDAAGEETELKTVITELQVDGEPDSQGFFTKSVPFSQFFDHTIFLALANQNPIPFDADNRVRIDFNFDSRLDKVSWHTSGQGADVVRNCLHFQIQNVPKPNKAVLAVIMILLLAVFTAFCWVFNDKYTKSNEDMHFNLESNLNAMTSGAPLQLDDYAETGEQVYYKELPEVHILVITKDQNTFLPDEERSYYNPENTNTDRQEGYGYYNPEIVNTVLMFYEDNFSGCLDLDTEAETDPEKKIVRAAANTTYYNITELYLNIPVVLEDGETYTLGEVFAGTVGYQDKTGYPAVQGLFRDLYHVKIASVTEIPEAVFAACYGIEERTAISVNRDFVRFMYDNYQLQSADRAIYASHAAKNMLAEARPYYPALLCQNLEKTAQKMGVDSDEGNLKNGMLFMDGASLTAFGNSVRAVSNYAESEYDHLYKNGYYENRADYPQEEWDSVKLQEIIHSNWDIVMVNILESISRMDNGAYTTLCKENHQEILTNIRSSLDADKLREFMRDLTKSNTVLGSEETLHEYVFQVRNLNLEMKTELGKDNVYLLYKPLEISPYTNRQVKKMLYYCLKYPKKVGDT